MIDREFLITIGMLTGIVLVFMLLSDKEDSVVATARLNFEGSANIPEHLKPPQLLFDGDSIIVTERPKNYNTLGLKMNFL
jgi:hypothetical protein